MPDRQPVDEKFHEPLSCAQQFEGEPLDDILVTRLRIPGMILYYTKGRNRAEILWQEFGGHSTQLTSGEQAADNLVQCPRNLRCRLIMGVACFVPVSDTAGGGMASAKLLTGLGVILFGGGVLLLWDRAPASRNGSVPVEVVRSDSRAAAPTERPSPLAPTNSPAKPPPEPTAAPRISDSVPPDPLLDKLLPNPSDDPRALHALVHSQARDAIWAPKAEAALKAEYVRIPYVGGAASPLRITCAATVCEVAGSTPQGLSLENTNVAWQALQGRALIDSVTNQGFTSGPMVFGKAGPDQSTFVAYFRKKS